MIALRRVVVSPPIHLHDSGTMVVDATTEEAAASVGQLTVAVNAHGELCGARKFGGTALPSDALVRCVQLAKQRCITITQ